VCKDISFGQMMLTKPSKATVGTIFKVGLPPLPIELALYLCLFVSVVVFCIIVFEKLHLL